MHLINLCLRTVSLLVFFDELLLHVLTERGAAFHIAVPLSIDSQTHFLTTRCNQFIPRYKVLKQTTLAYISSLNQIIVEVFLLDNLIPNAVQGHFGLSKASNNLIEQVLLSRFVLVQQS